MTDGRTDEIAIASTALAKRRAVKNVKYVFSNTGQMAGWMKTSLGTEVDLGPGHIVLDGVPAPADGAQQPPLFGLCLLWPRSPISVTAELLYKRSALTLVNRKF